MEGYLKQTFRFWPIKSQYLIEQSEFLKNYLAFWNNARTFKNMDRLSQFRSFSYLHFGFGFLNAPAYVMGDLLG